MASPTDQGNSRPFVRPALPDIPAGQRALLTTNPIPTPFYPSSQMSFSVVSRIHIAAPAAVVASTILDASKWGEWNSFVPSIQWINQSTSTQYPAGLSMPAGGKSLRVGDRFTMFVNMPGAPLSSLTEAQIAGMTQNKEVVSHVEALFPSKEEGREGFRICWKADGGFAGLVKAERVQECVQLADGGCEWVTWESFGGWLGAVVRLAVGGKLIERFGDWGRDLKGRSEELQKKIEAEEGRTL